MAGGLHLRAHPVAGKQFCAPNLEYLFLYWRIQPEHWFGHGVVCGRDSACGRVAHRGSALHRVRPGRRFSQGIRPSISGGRQFWRIPGAAPHGPYSPVGIRRDHMTTAKWPYQGDGGPAGAVAACASWPWVRSRSRLRRPEGQQQRLSCIHLGPRASANGPAGLAGTSARLVGLTMPTPRPPVPPVPSVPPAPVAPQASAVTGSAPCPGGTRSDSGGGPGGVPSPNGRPPSSSRPCGVSQLRRSGPAGTIPVGLMVRCTS